MWDHLFYLDKNNTEIYGIILCMFPTFNKKLYIDIIDTWNGGIITKLNYIGYPKTFLIYFLWRINEKSWNKNKRWIFPFWNGLVIFSKNFVSSGILLMYLCNWYKVYKHVINPLYSIPGSEVCVVCMGMCTLWVSSDSWSSLRERLVPSNYYVIEECHSVMGVII